MNDEIDTKCEKIISRIEQRAVILVGAGMSGMAEFELECKYIIQELQTSLAESKSKAQQWEFRYGEELGRRKAMEARAERAEAKGDVKRIHEAAEEAKQMLNAIQSIGQKAVAMEELYLKIRAVSGFTAEELLDLFAKGYVLKSPDFSNSINEMRKIGR